MAWDCEEEKGRSLSIRFYRDSDYEEVARWWSEHKEPVPPKDLIPQTTWIKETEDGRPWVCLSLITFNTPHIAWSAGAVSNPDVDRHGRKEAVQKLWEHVAEFTKRMGYKNLLCIAPNKKLEDRYKDLGFVPTKYNQTFMVKELGG